MKRLVLLALAMALIMPFSAEAQSQYARFEGSMSFIGPNTASGYSISGTFQGRFLGIFRPGFGVQALNMVSDTAGLLSHQSALDANLTWGVALKLGIRLQAGVGMFGRLWQKSFAADNSGPQLYQIDGVNYTLSQGSYVNFTYLTWGLMYYVSAGIDLTHDVELFAFYQGKHDMKKDYINTFGVGVTFRM